MAERPPKRDSGFLGLDEEELGKLLIAAAGAAIVLALLPAGLLAIPLLLAARGFGLGPLRIAFALAPALVPLLLVGPAQARDDYLDAGLAWQAPDAIGESGLGTWLGDVLPIALPLAVLIAIALRVRDAGRRDPAEEVRRRERKEAARRESGRPAARGGRSSEEEAPLGVFRPRDR